MKVLWLGVATMMLAFGMTMAYGDKSSIVVIGCTLGPTILLYLALVASGRKDGDT